MPLGLECDYRLRYMDFDHYGHIQPFALLDMFQDVATIQAEDMGIGRDDMMKKGVFWVVVRMKYEIVRQPDYFQTVKVKTWPYNPSRFSFMRDFSMRDAQGGLLAKASSEWVLVDWETRKFASVAKYYDGPDDFDDARSFEGKMRKVPNFEEDPSQACVIMPAYSDIDLNGHVNNAKYANFVMDALNPSEGSVIRSFQIDYRHEVRPGVPLQVFTQVVDGLTLVKGVNPDGDIAFASTVEFA